MRNPAAGLILILAFHFWLSVSIAASLQQGPPTRGSISGTTVPSDSTQPLAYVTLKLIPLDDPPPPTPSPTGRGGLIPVRNLQTTSGANGEFSFPGILPGHYAISADREGYQHYQTGPGQPNSSILTITNGQKIEGIVVAMTSVPAITGLVYNPYGQRLAGASVSAYRVEYTPYGRRVVRVATVLSHEGGEYRLFNLTPGYYYVGASYSDRSQQPWKSLLQLSPNLSRPDDGYSTLYFPREMRIADARAINVSNGEVANIDIPFKESNYFRLSINLILPPPRNPPHPLQNLKIALLPAGADLASAQDYVIRGSGTRFSVDRLAEGDYVVAALADLRDAAGNTYSGIVSDTRAVHLVEDTDVTIATIVPIEIPGSIMRSTPTALPGSMQIQLARVDALASQTITADVDASGQIDLLNVGPGIYDVFLKGLPANAFLQDTRFVAADRRLLQIKVDETMPARTWRCPRFDPNCPDPSLLSDVTLIATIGSNGSSISGNVVDAQGKKVVSAEVVFVPTDPAARLRKDRYATSYTDAAGAFVVQGLPPGQYNAYAFESLVADIYFDPDFNLQVGPLARPVMLGTGTNRPLNPPLTMISRDDLARYVR